MRVQHPDAVDGESVDVNGEYVPIADDGTFEVPDDATGWVDRWCDANGYDRGDVVGGETGADEETEICGAELSSGDGICERPADECPYHGDDGGD